MTPLTLGSGALGRARTMAGLLYVFSAGLLACENGHVTAPARGHIAIASGNAQRGMPGEPLALPLIAVVRDASGVPVTDVPVTWIADDGGAIDPSHGTTDATGTVAAMWTLGANPGPHRGRALATGYDAVAFTASTDRELPLDVIQPLTIATYDGSGQTVHPDFVATSGEWAHAIQYLFITPYPNGNPNFENPSVYETPDLVRWLAPDGVTNPIARPSDGYDSDPDALYEPDRNEIWLYYREVTNENTIRLTRSADAVHWSASVVVARAPNHEIISPTVVRRAPNDWLMWSVNGNVGCTGTTASVELRRSINGIDWSNPSSVQLEQPGVYPWHIDVEWIPSRNEYWALYNAKTSGSCTTGAVYLATSGDGVHWTTFPSPVLARGAVDDLRDIVYRSTFSYDPLTDAVTLWYSGARFDGGGYVWRSAVQRRLRADLFATISAAPRLATAAPVALPPLSDFP